MERFNTLDKIISSLFFIVPAILIIIGIIFFKYPLSQDTNFLLSIPLYCGLILLLIGFLISKEKLSNIIRIIGWGLFAFFWSTQPNSLYFGEDGDIVNASVAAIAIFLLFYLAYHEWLSIKFKKDLSCLKWIAGVAAISGIIYFGIELTPLAMQLRLIVAAQSGGLLNFFTGGVHVNGVNIMYKQAYIILIFACTAVQSMVIFVGMILPLPKVNIKKKVYGLIVTVIPVYFLNLVRNVSVIYLTGEFGPGFFSAAHNYIGKGGSIIVLILLLYIITKIIPEVFDEILNLTDLYKRNGPFESFVKKVLRKKVT
jgi:archaeosortase A (PGF-CTERM-specific)